MRHFKLRSWVIVLVGLDLLSKYIFYNLNYLNDTTLIWPTLNTGISRSLPIPFILIILVSIAGIAAFIRLFAIKKINWLIVALLIAGTAGNLIDRIMLWWVRDFINVWLFNFPIFNFADIMLSIGVAMRIAWIQHQSAQN